MKTTRILAATAGVALVGASAFAFAAPANAADVVAPSAPFPAEIAPYAASWFTGGGSVGTSSSDAQYGLEITAGPLPANTFQVLNGTPVTGDLTELVEAARMWVTDGSATFQIPVFGEPGETNQEYTTLRPVAASVPGVPNFAEAAQWITSRQLGTYAPGSTATIAEFETALEGGTVASYQILAFGAAVGGGQSGSISQITFAGNTHLFRAAPTGTQSATSVTTSQFDTTGITFTLTGLVPNEPLVLSGDSDFGTGIISEDEVADADGNFTFKFAGSTEFPSQPTPASFGIFGTYSGSFIGFDFAIVANPAAGAAAAPAKPQLAATGADLTGSSIAAGLLLLAGAGFGITAIRRRAAAAKA